MPVQQREHPQILRTACGLLEPDHISEIRDGYLHLPHAKYMGVDRELGVLLSITCSKNSCRDGGIRTRGLLLPKHQKRSFLFLILHPNSDIIAGRGIQ